MHSNKDSVTKMLDIRAEKQSPVLENVKPRLRLDSKIRLFTFWENLVLYQNKIK